MTDDSLDQLLRWIEYGGTWRLVDDGERSGTAVVDLLRCDGGECVDVLSGASPEFIDFVRYQQP